MPSKISAHRSIAKLTSFKRWLLTVTSGMGTSSPAEVLNNLIRILEGVSPRLRFAIALATPWGMLVAAISEDTQVWSVLQTIKTCVASTIYASVVIPGSHSLQKQVLAYVVEQGLGNSARALTLSSAQRDPKQFFMSYLNPFNTEYGSHGESQKQQRHSEPEGNDKPPLSYVPQVGGYVFWWKGHRMTLHQREVPRDEGVIRTRYHWAQPSVADIELSCFSVLGGAGPIREFLRFVQHIPTQERTTTIYRPQGSNWDAGIVLSSRGLNAVTMNSGVKDQLVDDVETYLAPATKKYYSNRGIPYRRGFLFYGPPGTGKTSFANAMARHFNLNVYMISLSTKALGDDMLEGLFEQLPNKCIVLLEDIDSAGIRRESMRKRRKKPTPPREASRDTLDEYGRPVRVPTATSITLSGLLNVLDGIHSREGMITIMTSNTPDSLDPALVRPGRIDRKVLFSYASKEVSAKLFRHIFEKTPEERVEGEVAAASEHDIAALSERFAGVIPADRLTPGDVQGFLLVNRACPVTAVAKARAWAETTLDIQSQGANVAAFAGAIRNEQSYHSSSEPELQGGARDGSFDDEEDTASEASSSTQDDATDPLAPARPLDSSPPPPLAGGFPPPPPPQQIVRALSLATSSSGFDGGTDRRAPRPRRQLETLPPGAGCAVPAGSSFPGQPTPPYSRSASRSPSRERVEETEAGSEDGVEAGVDEAGGKEKKKKEEGG